MSARSLRITAIVFGMIALTLVAIWLLQEFGIVAWLDDPATGAIGPAIIAMVLAQLARKKDAEQSA